MDRSVDRSGGLKKGVRIEYLATGWNVAEAIVALVAGVYAGSIALVGFGLDGIIMTVPAGMLLWRFRLELQGEKTKEEHTITERRALFVVGVAFILLSLYIINESGSKLYYREKPEESTVGLILAILSLVARPVFAVMKFRTSKALDGKALRADAIMTAISAYLSLTLFFGLGLHAWLGWWWADPVAALLMVPLIVREGWKAIEESKGNPSSGAVKTDS